MAEPTPRQRMLAMPDDTVLDMAPPFAAAATEDHAERTLADRARAIKRCPECTQKFSADGMFCPFDGARLEQGSWDPTGDTMLGKTVDGRYEIVGVLGEGGMGTVYEVKHTSLRRSFAMKVLRRDIAKENELAQRFMQEAKATASIKHPNVVSINDYGRLDDGTPYFVMELLLGRTLAQVLRGGGGLSVERATRIVQQISLGLGAAHAAGVVHRDLKPENVFLVRPPGKGEAASLVEESDVRIVDFGAAKVIGGGRLTRTGIVFGTPHYMSPEQASGQPVDHRADIYALGVIMYEIFTGKVPFEADTYMGVLTQHMFVHPAPPSQVAPEKAAGIGALEDVTMRALEKKPELRYQTMQALATDIQRVVKVSPEGRMEVVSREASPVKQNPRVRRSEVSPWGDTQVDASPAGLTRRPSARSFAILGGATVSAAILLFVLFRTGRPVAPSAPVVVQAVAPPAPVPVPVAVPVPLPAAPPSSLHLTSTPSFAEVWSADGRIGTTPMDLTVAAGSRGVLYLMRSNGYLDKSVLVDGSGAKDVHVDLTPKPRPPGGVAEQRHGAPSHHSRLGDLGDPWATKP